MKVRGSGLRRLVRRNVRRHKIDSSQLAAFASGLRKCQMALVDGIECAAKEADVHKIRRASWVVRRGPNPKRVGGLRSSVVGLRHNNKLLMAGRSRSLEQCQRIT